MIPIRCAHQHQLPGRLPQSCSPTKLQRFMHRRSFLGHCGLASLSLALKSIFAAETEFAPRILLRSSWQTVNIGDIAHTPGLLSLLRKHLPEAEVTLWPSNVDHGVEQLLMGEFPNLRIAKPGSKALKQAFEECDFLLHGSGPTIVAERDLIRWQEETGKPYGIYGITFPMKGSTATSARSKDALARSVEVLSQAQFVYFRDSKSLELAKRLGARSPVMEFGPDAAFACDLRDPEKAETFLAANQLKEGEFLCCIPRLRYTPYWTIKKHAKFDAVKHARNEAMKEHDHAPLRNAIVQVVKQTDLKVLICPEDRTQMAVGKEMLYDKLPRSVLERVVWRPDYWLTGEAISVYVRSAGLFGNEMHSPIMCIGHGVPAIVCRFAEQTSKGFMWDDIGLSDWLFDHDSPADQQQIVPAVLDIATKPAIAKAKAEKARAFVEKRQKETMDSLRRQWSH
ncbi:MAG: polysaccharide pyruvyl transferase [Gemmatales bacterium]|nr:MAG: polysaccharide pyruvyl transferase [Gemmatales bacterium]